MYWYDDSQRGFLSILGVGRVMTPKLSADPDLPPTPWFSTWTLGWLNPDLAFLNVSVEKENIQKQIWLFYPLNFSFWSHFRTRFGRLCSEASVSYKKCGNKFKRKQWSSHSDKPSKFFLPFKAFEVNFHTHSIKRI